MKGFYQQPALWPAEWYYKKQEEGHDDPATKVQAGKLGKTVSRPKWRNSWYYGHGESSARF